MREIRAFIRTEKLSSVCMSLQQVEWVTGMTVTDARGFGRSREDGDSKEVFGFRDCSRMEVFCSDEIAEQIVSTIVDLAYSGLRGDGKVYVSPVGDAVRIGSGDRDENAV